MNPLPTNEQLIELGAGVYEAAEAVFRKCEAESDFCIQNPDTLVFGGTNRIWLKPWGWVASRHHCTPRFLSQFKGEGLGRIA